MGEVSDGGDAGEGVAMEPEPVCASECVEVAGLGVREGALPPAFGSLIPYRVMRLGRGMALACEVGAMRRWQRRGGLP